MQAESLMSASYYNYPSIRVKIDFAVLFPWEPHLTRLRNIDWLIIKIFSQ